MAVILFALLCAVALGVAFIAFPQPERLEEIHATAIAYEPGPFVQTFRIDGGLVLERIPSNRSWYCAWLMLAADRPQQLDQPFLQVGLIRWARNDFKLSAFVADAHDANAIRFRDLGVVSEGLHNVGLRADGVVLHVLVDGRDRETVRLRSLFNAEDRVYAQIAGEVAEPGDRIRARLQALQILHDGGQTQPYRGRCRYQDRGLFVEVHGNAVRAGGRFATWLKSDFVGCERFFDNGTKNRTVRLGNDSPDRAVPAPVHGAH